MASQNLSRLGRGHRRRSISVPTGLDALLAFAEKSWVSPSPNSNAFLLVYVTRWICVDNTFLCIGG